VGTSTPPRIFRHVATLIGLQLVTSFVSVAKTLGQSRETAQRQLNAEKKKRKEGARIESLNKQLSEKHEKITMVEEMMRKIFTGFVCSTSMLEYLLDMTYWPDFC
jgi:cohesin complex subunit SA-1/2